jgi:hypothetical protein
VLSGLHYHRPALVPGCRPVWASDRRPQQLSCAWNKMNVSQSMCDRRHYAVKHFLLPDIEAVPTDYQLQADCQALDENCSQLVMSYSAADSSSSYVHCWYVLSHELHMVCT